MENLIDNIFHNACIEIIYLPATNEKGERVKLVLSEYDKKINVNWCYDFSKTWEVAINYLEKKGLTHSDIICLTSVKNKYLLVVKYSTIEKLRENIFTK